MSTNLIRVDIRDLDAVIDGYQARLLENARPAAQAGAEVLYRAVLRNVNALGKKTGNLEKAIYQAHSTHESRPGVEVYHVSWNPRKAPHGYILEYGHIQRYAVHLAPDGNWYTLIRPGMRGKRKPSRRASQAVKDAYYVPRPGGPVQVPAAAFVRKAMSDFDRARAAMENRLLEGVA